MKVVVTIDTEADNQWVFRRELRTENIGRLRGFQALCEDNGIRPTYLITSEIASDAGAAAFLGSIVEKGQAEVGAHLHPWTTPPFKDERGLRFNDEFRSFPSELDEELLDQKLETLTAQIEEAVGRRPCSFRAGRFGFNLACAKSLLRLGYAVDSSVTPRVSWETHTGMPGGCGGPNFRRFDTRPFWISGSGDPCGGLLELPVSIVLTNRILRLLPKLLAPYQKIADKFGLKPQPVWLRPFPGTSAAELVSVLEILEEEEELVAVMMFHSSELLPGGSPYWLNGSSVEQLLAVLKDFFQFVYHRNMESLTLIEAAGWIVNDLGLERGKLDTRKI